MVIIVMTSLAMVSLCFIDGLKYSISHDDQSKIYIIDHVYPDIFTLFYDHTYSLTHKDTHSLTSKLNDDMVTTHCPLRSLMSRGSCTLATLGMLTSTIKLAISP